MLKTTMCKQSGNVSYKINSKCKPNLSVNNFLRDNQAMSIENTQYLQRTNIKQHSASRHAMCHKNESRTEIQETFSCQKR